MKGTLVTHVSKENMVFILFGHFSSHWPAVYSFASLASSCFCRIPFVVMLDRHRWQKCFLPPCLVWSYNKALMLFTKEKCHESSDVVISKFIRETSFGFSLILYTVTLPFQPRTLSAIFSFCTWSFSRSLKGVGKAIPE